MDDAAHYIDMVNAAISADDLPRAAALSRAALAAGVKHPLMVRLIAEDLEQRGEAKAATAFMQRALTLMPGEPALLVKLAQLLAANGQSSDALRLFGEAAKTPAFAAEAHYGMARALLSGGDIELARKHLDRALELAPEYDEARATLALLLARTGEGRVGRVEAERLLAKDPADPQARIAMAVADNAERDFAAAEQRMQAFLAEPDLGSGDRAAALAVLADALNGLKRIPEAFDAYGRANDLMREVFAKYGAPSAQFSADIKGLIRAFIHEKKPERWAAVPLAKDEPVEAGGHAFLVGFPRSGTTLFEQILASHKGVVTLEEKATLLKVDNELLRDGSDLDRLARISPEDAARYRRNYWRVVKTFCDPRGKTFIDKMPINSISLPVVAKLFPNAKILFARRDPRDVVLSCFRRAFMINPMTYTFTTLEGSARLYDAVMTLADLYRRALPLPVHEVRYERLVADFEGETRQACAFLDIPWEDGMKEFAAASATRTVSTPSAAQVRRGLYQEGQGQWRAYAAQMAPVLPILEPWIGPKGYPVE
ncbi:MAG TPA: sulfotransferase [Caulobacteraceae bacterium]